MGATTQNPTMPFQATTQCKGRGIAGQVFVLEGVAVEAQVLLRAGAFLLQLFGRQLSEGEVMMGVGAQGILRVQGLQHVLVKVQFRSQGLFII